MRRTNSGLLLVLPSAVLLAAVFLSSSNGFTALIRPNTTEIVDDMEEQVSLDNTKFRIGDFPVIPTSSSSDTTAAGNSTTPGKDEVAGLSVIWYVGAFGGLIAFFLVVTCSEWCCGHRAYLSRRGSLLARNSQQLPPPATPPPPYHLFAPPDYKETVKEPPPPIYIIPVST